MSDFKPHLFAVFDGNGEFTTGVTASKAEAESAVLAKIKADYAEFEGCPESYDAGACFDFVLEKGGHISWTIHPVTLPQETVSGNTLPASADSIIRYGMKCEKILRTPSDFKGETPRHRFVFWDAQKNEIGERIMTPTEAHALANKGIEYVSPAAARALGLC